MYWALVDALPPDTRGELRHYLRRDSGKNKSFAGTSPGNGKKEAVLRYRLLHSLQRYHLLEVELLTGRHHQIRAQLAQIAVHIRGDLKYGAARSNPDGGISLHARSISFEHPVKHVPLDIDADPRTVQGDDLWKKFPIYDSM